jgi:hypothetical protein
MGAHVQSADTGRGHEAIKAILNNRTAADSARLGIHTWKESLRYLLQLHKKLALCPLSLLKYELRALVREVLHAKLYTAAAAAYVGTKNTRTTTHDA